MSKLKLTGPALLIALLVSLPALRDGLLDHTLPTASMIIRVVLALLFAMVGVAWVSSVVDSFRLQNMLRRNREESGQPPVRRGADRDTANR